MEREDGSTIINRFCAFAIGLDGLALLYSHSAISNWLALGGRPRKGGCAGVTNKESRDKAGSLVAITSKIKKRVYRICR